MNIAITCDYLIERNHYLEIIEAVCELYPEARLYTFVHKEGAILGNIERRRITSTHLSKTVLTEEDFYQHSSQMPLLAKNLYVSCEYDFIINISRGLSQGFKKCEKSRQLTYLYDIGFEGKVKKSIIQKLAFPWFLNFFVKSFKQADYIWVSRRELKDDLEKYIGNAEVVPPPFHISDYALFPSDMFKHHFYLVDSSDISPFEVRSLIGFFRETNREFQFIGNDSHLEALKVELTNENILTPNMFFGLRCSGEHAPVMASSKMFISFNKFDFPKPALATLATGRPVLVQSSQKSWIEGEGIYFLDGFNLLELNKILEQVESRSEEFSGSRLRAHANFYHDTKFKTRLKKMLEISVDTTK